jgi:hypothetical protein
VALYRSRSVKQDSVASNASGGESAANVSPWRSTVRVAASLGFASRPLPFIVVIADMFLNGNGAPCRDSRNPHLIVIVPTLYQGCNGASSRNPPCDSAETGEIRDKHGMTGDGRERGMRAVLFSHEDFGYARNERLFEDGREWGLRSCFCPRGFLVG